MSPYTTLLDGLHSGSSRFIYIKIKMIHQDPNSMHYIQRLSTLHEERERMRSQQMYKRLSKEHKKKAQLELHVWTGPMKTKQKHQHLGKDFVFTLSLSEVAN